MNERGRRRVFSWSVKCQQCGSCLVINPLQLGKSLDDAGWIYDEQQEYICPNCQKTEVTTMDQTKLESILFHIQQAQEELGRIAFENSVLTDAQIRLDHIYDSISRLLEE